MTLKIALLALAMNSQGDYETVTVKLLNSPQACIEAQVDYLNRNEWASCRPVLPNGTVVPSGHYPRQILNSDNSITYSFAPYPSDMPSTAVIRPPRYERPADIVIEVR